MSYFKLGMGVVIKAEKDWRGVLANPWRIEFLPYLWFLPTAAGATEATPIPVLAVCITSLHLGRRSIVRRLLNHLATRLFDSSIDAASSFIRCLVVYWLRKNSYSSFNFCCFVNTPWLLLVRLLPAYAQEHNDYIISLYTGWAKKPDHF